MMSARPRAGFGYFAAACSFAVLACSSAEPSATAIGAPAPANPGTAPSAPPNVPGVVQSPGPLFYGAVVQAAHAAPVVGGTLLVTRNGQTIAAADPDRDALFLVDAASHSVREVTLSPGDEPGRVVEGPDGTLYVALRRAGAVIAIDVATATIAQRASVCASPRGITYDAPTAVLYVACRSGLLATLSAKDLSLSRKLQLDPDLRDVIVHGTDLVVTRYLSAEVMVVAPDGSVSRRASPDPLPGCADATVAFRAFSMPDGKVAIAHQASSDQAVNETEGGYGFSCGGSLVGRFLTLVDTDTPSSLTSDGSAGSSGDAPGDPEGDQVLSSMTFQSQLLPGAGPLDAAFNAQGDQLAVIALDDSLANGQPPVSAQNVPNANLWLTTWGGQGLPRFPFPQAGSDTQALAVKGQPVAVAFTPDGQYVVQSREPATLELEGGISVALSDASHADSGHLMFHMNSGIGISCSSCHPEGGEDGHVWRFNDGLRRTLPLEGGVLERAPFHWDGTLGDMNALVNEVMIKRMALAAVPSDTQIAALGSFLEQLPGLPPTEGLDAAAVERGQALFQRSDVACATCHSGPQYTNNQLVDVGTGGKFVTPSLLGVGLRNALFHDGCAKNVAQRFGVCGGTAHGKPELLSAAERADMIVFLRSL